MQKYGRHLVNPTPTHSASRQLSQSLLNSTIALMSSEQVIGRDDENGHYWLVASKVNERFSSPVSPTGYWAGFTPRYYVVRFVDGCLVSSAQDPQTNAECLAQVEASALSVAC